MYSKINSIAIVHFGFSNELCKDIKFPLTLQQFEIMSEKNKENLDFYNELLGYLADADMENKIDRNKAIFIYIV